MADIDSFMRRVANGNKRIETNKTAPVYFIQCDCPTGFIKIGMAADPGARLLNMQTSCPYPLRLLATMPGGMAAEKEMHRRFAAANVGGEWFSPVPELMVLIAERAAAIAAETPPAPPLEWLPDHVVDRLKAAGRYTPPEEESTAPAAFRRRAG